MMTLAELNAAAAARHAAAAPSQYVTNLSTTYHVGRNGTSRRGTSGDKLHVVYVTRMDYNGQTITSAHGLCGSRNDGRSRVAIIDGLDTDRVTCTKCRASLEG